VGRWRICEDRSSAGRPARDPLNRAISDAMFKIIAVVVIGIFGGIGFFDLGQEAYTLAAHRPYQARNCSKKQVLASLTVQRMVIRPHGCHAI
jgi:hypothetical protein